MTKYLYKDVKILCLEDDPEMRKNLLTTIVRLGFSGTLDCAEDGEHGKALVAKNGKYDIVISDMVMPNCTGHEFVKHYREEIDKKSETLVLMLTSITTKEVVLDCISAGADDYVVKPVEEVSLSKKILNAWNNKYK